MAEKKTQENPPETSESTDKQNKDVSKTTTVPLPVTAVVTPPAFTKTPPNDLYRKLLPAVLFLLTFVTVMTMLLIYMDTVALGAHQFRVNMTRDYELSRIPQESPTLVAYVRQLHLAPRRGRAPTVTPERDERVKVIDEVLGEIYNGTFVECLPAGARVPATLYLESARRWAGVAMRAEPRAFLELRGAARPLHACLSPTEHPREIMYRSPEGSPAFSSRVLCLPLYTVLLAADAAAAQYVLLGGDAAPRALAALPAAGVSVKIFEVFAADAAGREHARAQLAARRYVVAASFPDSVMYRLLEEQDKS